MSRMFTNVSFVRPRQKIAYLPDKRLPVFMESLQSQNLFSWIARDCVFLANELTCPILLPHWCEGLTNSRWEDFASAAKIRSGVKIIISEDICTVLEKFTWHFMSPLLSLPLPSQSLPTSKWVQSDKWIDNYFAKCNKIFKHSRKVLWTVAQFCVNRPSFLTSSTPTPPPTHNYPVKVDT